MTIGYRGHESGRLTLSFGSDMLRSWKWRYYPKHGNSGIVGWDVLFGMLQSVTLFFSGHQQSRPHFYVLFT